MRMDSTRQHMLRQEASCEGFDERAIARNQAQPEPAVEEVVERKRSFMRDAEEKLDAEHGQIRVQSAQQRRIGPREFHQLHGLCSVATNQALRGIDRA